MSSARAEQEGAPQAEQFTPGRAFSIFFIRSAILKASAKLSLSLKMDRGLISGMVITSIISGVRDVSSTVGVRSLLRSRRSNSGRGP